jgi:hypothetical protein
MPVMCREDPIRMSRSTKTPLRASTLVRAAAVAGALAAAAGVAGAQSQDRASLGARLELRPIVGAFLATGAEHDLLENAVLAGAEAAYRFHRNVAVVAAVAWSPSSDRTTRGAGAGVHRGEDVDLYQYDLGVEGRLPDLAGGAAWTVSPFGTLGAGGRTYHYRDVDGVDAQTDLVGYAGAGADAGPRGGRWGVRVEARDYVTAFKGLRGELPEREARNDVVVAAGLTFTFGHR